MVVDMLSLVHPGAATLGTLFNNGGCLVAIKMQSSLYLTRKLSKVY